eukprot:scaffold1710_cov126-Isochrysis_galbana.AAC.2
MESVSGSALFSTFLCHRCFLTRIDTRPRRSSPACSPPSSSGKRGSKCFGSSHGTCAATGGGRMGGVGSGRGRESRAGGRAEEEGAAAVPRSLAPASAPPGRKCLARSLGSRPWPRGPESRESLQTPCSAAAAPTATAAAPRSTGPPQTAPVPAAAPKRPPVPPARPPPHRCPPPPRYHRTPNRTAPSWPACAARAPPPPLPHPTRPRPRPRAPPPSPSPQTRRPRCPAAAPRSPEQTSLP